MGKPGAKRYFVEKKDNFDEKDTISKAPTGSGHTDIHTEMSTSHHDIAKQTVTKKKRKKSEDSISHDLSKVDFNEFKFSRRKPTRDFSSSGKRQQSMRERVDPFPGDAPIDKKKIKKYKRGRKMDVMTVKTGYHRHQFEMKEKKLSFATKQAARTELLLQEDAGFLEADEGEHTSEVSQGEIAEAVDINSAQKYFELKLDKFGPYRINYTRNGRFLLIGGGRGHVAAIDWQTKKLLCEINAMETCYDAKWLHFETMFAVAQKQWTYIYDNQGVELHCLKILDQVLRLEFLPYHFLLASASAKGYLNYIDVSIGKKVAGFHTGLGRLDVMCQNPHNAIINLGHSGGTVTMWSPNVKNPLVKMLCHGSGTRSITVDQTGQYMATSGIDRTMKLWDLRTFKLLHSYKIGAGANNLAFSARHLLAAGVGNVVQIYKDTCSGTVTAPYLTHRPGGTVHGLQFCPYEDVLGVGHGKGFSSLLVPGAGEPNFDALEANPFQTKKQRQHAEVNMLLEKIQPDMIAMDTSALGKVDKKTIMETMEEKKKLLYLKPKKIEFEPKYKKKGRSKSGKVEKRKKGVQLENKRDQIREFQQKKMAKRKTDRKQQDNSGSQHYNVFDRFKQKQD